MSERCPQHGDRRNGRRGFLLRDESGSVSIETILVLPLLLWALAATVSFTDAFRSQATLQRSAFTVADLLSRSSGRPVTPALLDGLHGFQVQINENRHPVRLRNSLIARDDDAEALRVVWSYGSNLGDIGPLTHAELNGPLSSRVPPIAPGETTLLTEAWLDYTPPLRVGLRPRRFHEAIVTRPRFAPGVYFEDPNAPPPPTHWCEYVIDACGM